MVTANYVKGFLQVVVASQDATTTIKTMQVRLSYYDLEKLADLCLQAAARMEEVRDGYHSSREMQTLYHMGEVVHNLNASLPFIVYSSFQEVHMHVSVGGNMLPHLSPQDVEDLAFAVKALTEEPILVINFLQKGE